MQGLLSRAENGDDLEEKFSLYTDALALQLFKGQFKYKAYDYLHDGKENQNYAETQVKDAAVTMGLMQEYFGDDAVAEIYLILYDYWNTWIDEQFNNLMYDLSSFINVKGASTDELWEAALAWYGGIESFYNAQ